MSLSSKSTQREKTMAAMSSVLAAVGLTGLKILVAVLTGSLGIMAEAAHSGLDLVAALMTFFAVRVADKPADEQHHFGHGKAENVSALFETLLLLATSGWIIYEAIHRLTSPEVHVSVSVWSFIVMGTSIVIDATRSRVLMNAAKKHNSQALEADALHFSTDIWSSSVVLFGLICANFGFFFADSVAALIVAIIVLFVSYKLGRRAIDVLLDKAPKGTIEKVE